MNHQLATPHHQHIAFHQLRITARGPSRHGIGRHPAVVHPQPTLRPAPGGGAVSQGPDLRLEPGRASGGQRFLCRGDGNLGRCVVAWGGSAWIKGHVASRVSVLMAWCAENHFTTSSLSPLHIIRGHHHLHHREPDSDIVTRVVEKKFKTLSRQEYHRFGF